MQHTVNPKAYPGFIFVWFNVNISGSAVHRLEEDRVDSFSNRCFVDNIEQVFGLGPAAGSINFIMII